MKTLTTDEEKVRHIAESLRRKVPVFSERVAPVYRVLEWRWGDDSKAAPTAKKLAALLLEHINATEATVLATLKEDPKSRGSWLRSGGLCVGIEREVHEDGDLDQWEGSLQFRDNVGAYEWDEVPPILPPSPQEY